MLRSLNDADIYNYFLEGVQYTGRLVPNPTFTGTGPAQPYLNSALIGVIAYAPEDCEIAVNLKKSINYLDIVLSFTEPLAEFENLEELYLTGSEELENLVGLASLKKLKHINLKDCKSLRKADEIQGCKSLETLSIADCIGLTSLKLNELTQLNSVDLSQTIDKPQWYLQVLELKHLPSLKELSLLGQSANYNYAGVYYQFIELEELVLDSLEVLESVDISWAYPLTKLFISNCPSVHSLKREDLYLSDRNHETVDLRIKNLPKINYLCLNNLKFTSTKNICDLKTLEKLDMENCTELKDLKGIGRMTLLKNLNLSGCTSLLNLTGLEKSKSLNIITAKKCSNLTDPSAIRGLNNLVSVDFNGCKKLLPMPQTKLLGGRPDIEDYQIKLFVSLGEKPPRELNPIDPAKQKMLNENFSKMKKLIRSYRLELINQGVELMITINSPQIFEKFLFGTQIGNDGSLCAGPLFSAPKSSTEREYQQNNLNVGLLKLIQEAPEISIKNAGLNLADCSHLSLSKNANDWEYDDWDGISIGVYDIAYSTFQNLDFLDKFPNLTSLNLSGEALQNVDGLAKLTKLTSLDLRDCYSLQNIDGLANLTKLTNLELNDCKTLQNVDGLANLTNLAKLNLSNCEVLKNIDSLDNCTNLTRLELRCCYALKNVDGLASLTNLTSLDLSIHYEYSSLLENVDSLANLTNLNSLDLTDCKSIKPKPSQWNMSTRKKVASYQERIKKAM